MNMKQNIAMRSVSQQINGMMYDRIRVTTGDKYATMYTLVLNEGVTSVAGVVGGTKVLADTNMRQKGRTEVLKPMTVTGMYMLVEASKTADKFTPAGYKGQGESSIFSAEDIQSIIQGTNVVLQVGTDTEYLSMPLVALPPPVGIATQFGGGDVGLASAMQVGQVYEFLEPLEWTNDISINVRLDFGDNGLVIPSGNIARITAVLTGTFSKAVQ